MKCTRRKQTHRIKVYLCKTFPLPRSFIVQRYLMLYSDYVATTELWYHMLDEVHVSSTIIVGIKTFTTIAVKIFHSNFRFDLRAKGDDKASSTILSASKKDPEGEREWVDWQMFVRSLSETSKWIYPTTLQSWLIHHKVNLTLESAFASFRCKQFFFRMLLFYDIKKYITS